MFSLLETFLRTELFLIYPILIWSRSRVIDIVWKNMLHNIPSNEWELKVVYQQSFPVEKKIGNSFLTKVFRSSFAVYFW